MLVVSINDCVFQMHRLLSGESLGWAGRISSDQGEIVSSVVASRYVDIAFDLSQEHSLHGVDVLHSELGQVALEVGSPHGTIIPDLSSEDETGEHDSLEVSWEKLVSGLGEESLEEDNRSAKSFGVEFLFLEDSGEHLSDTVGGGCGSGSVV